MKIKPAEAAGIVAAALVIALVILIIGAFVYSQYLGWKDFGPWTNGAPAAWQAERGDVSRLRFRRAVAVWTLPAADGKTYTLTRDVSATLNAMAVGLMPAGPSDPVVGVLELSAVKATSTSPGGTTTAADGTVTTALPTADIPKELSPFSFPAAIADALKLPATDPDNVAAAAIAADLNAGTAAAPSATVITLTGQYKELAGPDHTAA